MKMKTVPILLAAAGAMTLSSLPAGATPAASNEPPAVEPHRHGTLGHKNHFDLQAHRGGMGLYTESTREAFANALEMGVTTLELDVQITSDGKAVVTHDRQVSAERCEDTEPVTPGDPQFPYVGKYVKNLTLAQVQSLNCGYQQHPDHPDQKVVPGAQLLELHEVFDVVKDHKAKKVMMNIETKVEAGAPEETAPREQFVNTVAAEVRKADVSKQVTIQSFDWGSLRLMHEVAPELPLVALTNYDFLEVGQEGASPWLGGIDADDHGGDLVESARALDIGVDAISPVHGFPQDGVIGDPGYRPYVDRDMVRAAHDAGMKVVPWTVNDRDTMGHLIELGIDGLITDYPDRLREVMAAKSMKLPKPYPER